MNIFETWDATWLNHVANRPAIFLELSRGANGEPFDFSECAARDDYRIICCDDEAFLVLDAKTPAVYELHIVFDDSCRGKRAVAAGKAMVEWVWGNTECQILFGGVPVENVRARMFSRLVGASSSGVIEFNGLFGEYLAETFYIVRPAPLDK